jgi:hypothetical protein
VTNSVIGLQLITGLVAKLVLFPGVIHGTQKLGKCLSFPVTMLEMDFEDDGPL